MAISGKLQAIYIAKRIHQVIEDSITTFELSDNNYVKKNDPWKYILADTAFTIFSTNHTNRQKSPVQLFLGGIWLCQLST